MEEMKIPKTITSDLTPSDSNSTYDSDLYSAALEVVREGVLTPLIKQELKYTIQSRRVAEGKGELMVEFNDPESFPLSMEEKEKVIKRREQNREAARRFRDRQKQVATSLRKRVTEIERKYSSLQEEYRKLMKERDILADKLHTHLLVCDNSTINHFQKT